MKVTVCFGAVRIVVPCGSGDLLVSELITEAIRRYKKAVGKEPSSWVSVHHLSTQSGILDPDDCIRDVADDREEILASFEDSGPDPGVPQGGGDGASGSSSVGTGSPDIFRDPTNTDKPTNAGTHADHSTPHIEITSTTMCPVNGLGLQVRRSSDPNMLATLKAEMGNKRWSAAAPHCAGDSPERIPLDKSGGNLTPQWEEEDDLGMQQQQQQQHHPQHTLNAPAQQHNFVRSVRSSMQFLGDGSGHKWLDAVEKLQNQQQHQHAANYQYQHQNHQQLQHQNSQQQSQSQSQQHSLYTTKSLPRESKRKEPLGQAYESMREKAGEMLLIINEQGSRLGFTALPDNEHGGGLLVQFVESGSRADRGRLRVGDRILEINGTKLIGLTESKIQEQLRRSLDSSELRVRVIRAEQKDGKMRRKDSKVAEMIEAEEKIASGVESKIATVSPTRKPQTAPIGCRSLQIANTRKLGRKIEISLKKGPKGLGFSVTTRDNPAGGQCPIYIKNIMGYGAAIEDGRLKPGDRLLEIDGVPITGKTQSEVVAILRATQPGATVHLVVSRQQDLNDSDEREQNAQQEKENDLNSPPKPPAPVLPVSMRKQQEQNATSVKKSSSARSIHEQQKHLQQQQQLQQQQLQQQQQHANEFMDIFDAGSESATSSDSLKAGIAWNSREILTLHIPWHDTDKAGLGVSVKGKTNSNNNQSNSSGSGSSIKHDGDLGIFIKSVIHGGAASRDGRLRMNDQLLSVNGVSLLGQNNAEAMDTLRRAMINNPGKHPGMITLSVARKITRSASSSDILEKTNDSSNTSENSGATVIYLTPEKKDARNSNNGDATNDMNRWSNPVLDRLTGGVCSSNSSQHSRRPSRDNLLDAATLSSKHPTSMVGQMHAGLRNDSYYMATHDTWSPAVPQASLIHGGHINNNNSVLIEDDPEPMSPTLPHRLNDSTISMPNSSANNSAATGVNGAAASFDATYSSQLSLETNNSGVDYFNRDATIRQSMSEKHAGKKDAQKTDTYQRRQKVREEIERERRKQLTKSAVYGGSVESLSVRIAQANAQVPGYKHAKTASGIETQNMQAEANDKVGDLGPSLGLKKSSSLESLQTMVQEIQMSDEPRGRPTTLRAPRGRGREEGLREAVVNDTGKPWLFEDGRTVDADGGFANRGVFQSSLNDGKHKSRAKKPGILRGIGHMFRFGKNRKDTVMPTESRPTRQAASNIAPTNATVAHNVEHNERAPINVPHNQIPAAALAAMERNTKLSPPAYQQPPPPMPSQNNSNGIHANDTFNQRYPHYSNYDEPTQLPHQISDENNPNHANNDELSESTLECMRQQVLMQRIKCVEAESRRHQHYHSQRSARSQDINLHVGHHHNLSNNLSGSPANGIIRPSSSYYEYETVSAAMQQHRSGSIKQNGHTPSPITINAHQQQQHTPQPHWKIATMNGYSPSSLNSSARSRGPFITQVNIGNSSSPNSMAVQQQATYQTVQRQQPQYANNVSTNASKV